MLDKKKFSELVRFDISNKMVKELADLESRHILFVIVKKSKSAQEIAEELNIPTSTVYKKLRDLSKLSLISEEKRIPDEGRVTRYYQSRINGARISIRGFEPSISLDKNLRVGRR